MSSPLARVSKIGFAPLAAALFFNTAACEEIPFYAPECTVHEPHAFASYLDDATIEVVVTAPFKPDVSRGAYSTIQTEDVSGAILLSQSHGDYLVVDVKPAAGATTVTFRTSELCYLSGEDPSDGASYPHYVATLEIPADPAAGQPVEIAFQLEAST
jgi:hypothetical protein